MIPRRFLSVLIIAVVYLFVGMMITFDSVVLRTVLSLLVVAAVCYFVYGNGTAQGENDAAHGEIMAQREAEGRPVSQTDRERCFHPLKGFFAAAAGTLPFFIFCLIFAFLTRPAEYMLGALPSWVAGFSTQSEFSDGLAYYSAVGGMAAIDIIRIIDRAMVMPFISVAALISDEAALTVERLSPMLVLIAPMFFGIGYAQGKNIRARINTGILEGVNKKRRKETKDRRKRAQQRTVKKPEQLI